MKSRALIVIAISIVLMLAVSVAVNAETTEGRTIETAKPISLDIPTTIDFDYENEPFNSRTSESCWWFVFQPDKAGLYDIFVDTNTKDSASGIHAYSGQDNNDYQQFTIEAGMCCGNDFIKIPSTKPVYFKIYIHGRTSIPTITIKKHTHNWIPEGFCGKEITYWCSESCGASQTLTAYPWLSCTKYTYDGRKHKPTLEIRGTAAQLVKESGYKSTFPTDSTAIGKYEVRVEYLGDYELLEPVNMYYYISPKGTSIKKLSKSKKAFTVKWKKQTNNTTGYTIRYSGNSNMSNYKLVYVSKKATSKKIKKLKAKKTYYVQVSTYKKVGGTKVYSGWSSMKKVKTR